jgi:ubiquinone/menaquinone biosynthesis C-methylase UbiE
MNVSLHLDSSHLADTYNRLSDSQFESGQSLVERLHLHGPVRVLDVGCGTGRLALWAATTLADGSHVVGVDPLPERIALANSIRLHSELYASSARSKVTFAVGGAEDLHAFDDASFDAVYLSAVFHWVADKPRALAEFRRVLRPGGRLGITTNPRELLPLTTLQSVTRTVLAKPPYAGLVDANDFAPGRNGVTTTELLSLLVKADFAIAETAIQRRIRYHKTGAQVVEFIDSSSFGNYLSHVPSDLRDRARRDLAEAFEATRQPSGIPLLGYTAYAIAERL